ncbi:NAD(P)H-dependent oxidoreductase [Nocardia sp. 2]|uniref:NAD(P)H-dependent oxidoreductase n=1 Tax=Nocardia acididurans TaxID=2802282 RepID=A0ABS1M096_9NOCA|nr:NAD(P)H-dependent oxidoreductase [Nocardia acididurans]MBL1073470.1 NAD(P)H-dependent oxidoreductase [Nocardia acididurans]
MSTAALHIAVLTGSIREGRFGPTVANWIAARAADHGELTVDLIDLADHPVPAVLGDADNPGMAGLTARLTAADAFVVVTPEYNHSYPASLKSVIDWHYTQWQAKPIGFVSYGGLAGGLRAVEHLRPVFSELHATTIRDTVSFHNCWDKFDATGNAVDPAADVAAKTMLDQLTWWGHALRDARSVRPYAS